MPTAREHLCVRCGIDVYERGAACRDCLDVDWTIVRSWRT